MRAEGPLFILHNSAFILHSLPLLQSNELLGTTRSFPTPSPDAPGLWSKQCTPEFSIVHYFGNHDDVVAIREILTPWELQQTIFGSSFVSEVDLERLFLIRQLRIDIIASDEMPPVATFIETGLFIVRPHFWRT